MIPKSAVADSATITRLCARWSFRSLISISVLRHHGGLRRDDDAVAGGVANHRDPGLEEERDLDGDRPPAGRADAGAVPDEPGVGRCRGRGSGARWTGKAWIRAQGEPTSKLALDGVDDVGVGWQGRVEGDRGPSTFSGGVRDRVVDVDGAAQVDGAKQQKEEDRGEHRELDHRLAAVAAEKALAHQYSALKVALVLMVRGLTIRRPMMGVMKLNLKLAVT